MARGKDKHTARQQALQGLGRELARRAKSRCELCSAQEALFPTELPPEPEEPTLDSALLLCSSCRPLLNTPPQLPVALSTHDREGHFLFLQEAVWSETAPAQIAAVRLLRELISLGEAWAMELNESLYLMPEIEERL